MAKNNGAPKGAVKDAASSETQGGANAGAGDVSPRDAGGDAAVGGAEAANQTTSSPAGGTEQPAARAEAKTTDADKAPEGPRQPLTTDQVKIAKNAPPRPSLCSHDGRCEAHRATLVWQDGSLYDEAWTCTRPGCALYGKYEPIIKR